MHSAKRFSGDIFPHNRYQRVYRKECYYIGNSFSRRVGLAYKYSKIAYVSFVRTRVQQHTILRKSRVNSQKVKISFFFFKSSRTMFSGKQKKQNR